MTALVAGIDPGGRYTGLVARFGNELLAHELVEGDAINDLPSVIDRIRSFVARLDHFGFEGPLLVAAEAVNAPTGFKHGRREPINPKGLIGTALVLGTVVATWPNVVIVPPGDHGAALLRAYPEVLVGPREGPAGTGKLRHCRSAWDIAGVGARLASMRRRTVRTGG